MYLVMIFIVSPIKKTGDTITNEQQTKYGLIGVVYFSLALPVYRSCKNGINAMGTT